MSTKAVNSKGGSLSLARALASAHLIVANIGCQAQGVDLAVNPDESKVESPQSQS